VFAFTVAEKYLKDVMRRTCTPDIDANLSHWLAGWEDYQASEPLRQKIYADLTIIGAGFTGVSTAYHISQRFPDKKIVLLDAKTLANGASGRNCGLMLNWINGVSSDDPELTRLVYDTTREGIDLILQLIQTHQLKVRHKREGCLTMYTDSQRAEDAHAHAEELQSWGINVEYLSGANLSSRVQTERAKGAVFDASEGIINGVDLVRGLKPVLLSQGVEIYENTPVMSINEGKEIILTTPQGEIRSKAIVLATNGYTARLGYFRTGIFPLHSHMISTESLTPEQKYAIGWKEISGFSDDLDRIAFGGLTPDGGVIFGGGSNDAYSYLYGNRTQYPWSPTSANRSYQAVQDRLREYFPKALQLRIAHRWTGTLGITMSRLCSMGVRGRHRNVFYALGYSGHGIVLGNLAGKVLCDIYSGSDERWRKLPFYQKKLGGIPPDPFKWVGYHLYTRLTGRSPRA
jgi:gamma-glutamylputrescine oxidase